MVYALDIFSARDSRTMLAPLGKPHSLSLCPLPSYAALSLSTFFPSQFDCIRTMAVFKTTSRTVNIFWPESQLFLFLLGPTRQFCSKRATKLFLHARSGSHRGLFRSRLP